MSREIDPRDCQHGQADTEDAMKHNVMPCSDQFCKISPVSSRVCEKGTKGCTVYHDREQLCKRFHELTGGHWHELIGDRTCHWCSCDPSKQYRISDPRHAMMPIHENPTYSNPADVLKKIIEIGLYDEFMVQYGGLSKFGRHLDCILVDLILEPDALMKAAVEFLKEGEK
jgi:hypothetical protein